MIMYMKRALILWGILAAITTSCYRPAVVYYPAPRHDNGLHKGWYKQGKVKGIPPGQAKKMGRYGRWK